MALKRSDGSRSKASVEKPNRTHNLRQTSDSGRTPSGDSNELDKV